MDPQDNFCCYEPKKCCKCKKTNCLGIVEIILLSLFSLVIGLLVGASLSTAILGTLAAIIVLAVILGILLLLAGILYFCKKRKECC